MPGIDAFTVAMLHFDGADASTTITDSSLTPKAFTANGNAQIDTAQSVFGGASGIFDGTGDYITSNSASADFAPGSSDFTVDFRVRFANVTFNSSARQFLVDTTGNYCFIEWRPADGILKAGWRGGNDTISDATWSPSNDTWYHIALVRNASALKLFIAGTQAGTTTVCSDTGTTDQTLTVGSLGGGSLPLNGWIDELRVSRTARWTGNFTPPIAAYAVDVSTFKARAFIIEAT